MKIIILGAGQVGGSLAEHLAREKNYIIAKDNTQCVIVLIQLGKHHEI